MAMADVAARKAKPRATPYKIYDELGLYLLVNPGGSKLWRFKYSFAGKERLLAIGSYPLRSLREARSRRDDARRLLSDGIDPGLLRAQTKLRQLAASADSFEAVGREWFAKFSPHWAKSHADKVIRRLELYVFPWLGKRPIGELEPLDVLSVLRRIESRGLLETAHRVHQNCSQVFRYGVATGRAKRDVTVDLRGALAPWRPQHYPSITDPGAIGGLLRAIHGYKGGLVVASALKLAPLVFTRPGELRRAEWAELNLDAAEWRIPADKMKAGVPHVVPLSRQAVSILRELRPLTGALQYVFPSRNSRKKPMSENTVNAALRRLGYDKGQFTGHGFRSMASTILNEQGWKADAIERQLAHGERDKVRAAYNYAQHLAERRKMMQAWADYLDALREGRKVMTARLRKAA
ncbi:MAG: tyrosine-type recombinase/integrase [Nevskia sp.]|nr:tyrosine-type recombinase/integrase [Nevskia sp.]